VAKASRGSLDDPFLAIIAAGTGLSLVGFIVGSLGPSTVVGFAPLWILFGLVFAVARRAHERGLSPDREPVMSPDREGGLGAVKT
jgi:hypothetical protein